MVSPKGKLGTIADSDFPGALNVTLCLHVHAQNEIQRASNKTSNPVDADASANASIMRIVGPTPDAHAAYMAGCEWWTDTLDSYYNSINASHLDDDELEALVKAEESHAEEEEE